MSPHEFLIDVKPPHPTLTESFLTVMVPRPAGFPGFSIKGRVTIWLDTIWAERGAGTCVKISGRVRSCLTTPSKFQAGWVVRPGSY